MVLIMICVMAPVTAGAAEKSTGRPKITLNSSDPFEFSTVKDKQELLDEAGKYPEKFDLSLILRRAILMNQVSLRMEKGHIMLKE